ncbi:signal peptide peptidase SppA [Chamaesiphon sp.]|uniref:signal peptide peptidase SppA n=1 Tax=Chamaesiphon sp. TaxID=2814140 RepID=UPI0035939AD0
MFWPFNQKATKQIARIEIAGAIGSSTRKSVLKALRVVEERKYPALLLRIDSPGGTVGDSYEIYQALQRLQSKVKIVASYGNISASGGVYIGMGAPHIMANPGTLTGSIGVILRGNNLEKLLDRVGVSFQVIKSGPYKDILSFDRQLTAPEEQILQSLIDSTYEQFVNTVAESRHLDPATVRTFADGRIFTGEQAVEFGVVDRLGSEEDARLWLAELADLDPQKAKLHTIEERKPLVGRILQSQIPGFKTVVSTADWVQFELSTNGQPLWLYRP